MIDANKSLQIEQENKGLSEKLAELKEKCRSYERT